MPRSTQIEIGVPAGYPELVAELKTRIRSAQVRAAFAVNRELILLYWSVGRDILGRQADQGWGAKIIDRLAQDLQTEFPGIEGFSPRSLKYMRSFAAAWPDESIVQQVAAQLPWGHHMVLLDRAKDAPTRLWYLHAAVEHGWSRNILVHMIKGSMHEREGKALTNFRRTLPPEGSDMAEQILRDPTTSTSSPWTTIIRSGTRTRPAAPSPRSAAGAGPRLRLRRQPGSAGGRRRDLLYRPALLPSPAACLHRY